LINRVPLGFRLGEIGAQFVLAAAGAGGGTP
jgi:hypothetical protein